MKLIDTHGVHCVLYHNKEWLIPVFTSAKNYLLACGNHCIFSCSPFPLHPPPSPLPPPLPFLLPFLPPPSLADGVVLIDPEYFNKEGKKDRKGQWRTFVQGLGTHSELTSPPQTWENLFQKLRTCIIFWFVCLSVHALALTILTQVNYYFQYSLEMLISR